MIGDSEMSDRIERERIIRLNANKRRKGIFVLYWMQASQRASCNHALEYAIDSANEKSEPLLVFFGIYSKYPAANARHFRFMLEGLAETQRELAERGIRLIVRACSPDEGAIELAKQASLVVTDRAYMRLPRQWRARVASSIDCPLVQVETNVVVPVEEVSHREEYAARTIRPKIGKLLERYMVPLHERIPKRNSMSLDFESLDISNPDRTIDALGIERNVPPVDIYRGGTSEARERLRHFLTEKLARYPFCRNDPNAGCTSDMSPYLHFGQISPLEVALAVSKIRSPASDEYLEELLVRRELAINYVYYNENYDSFEGLPGWAKKTLRIHSKDTREYIYSDSDFEMARTHDPYWNAAEKEMILTGKMHNYMRMYWGKKILEWSRSPEEAFSLAIRLNDKYELDGRDPNGYAGVAWCFGKHDRPWRERPIFGLVRWMDSSGLKRKFDADLYVYDIEKLWAEKR